MTRSSALRDKLRDNTGIFREGLQRLGFELLPGEHPIVPVMLHDAALAGQFAQAMLEEGVYLAPSPFEALFLSAAHTNADIQDTLEASARVLSDLFEKGPGE